ncbi:uncharacterized protein MYCFIDRAFT_77993 [Pseudocercospora fijiensis CIRAD86]|uniref:ASST-domain-containing protein n=1 Tax=Pseudocercospora fijiensis (strain CIRAD86) TaxID=383855 RepID=M2YRA4_PSEFD|nr:uncharacterized protein MYCFIDRAFT_77993 [Pseudocercospora fijiensis CIRAD86]EME80230.1 hypothetical protein MYCFIDRAFT_77993 [Pseudocercospora fijiensis CIRAD86]
MSCDYLSGGAGFTYSNIHFHSALLAQLSSRPEIRAPKWNVNIHHPDLVSPGYWFVAPREPLGANEQMGGWIGPTIYDNAGELVWSGASTFLKTRVDDFRISHVAGELLMTMIWDEHGAGVMMNSSYEIVKAREFTRPHLINMHEFHFVDDGRRAIILRGNRKKAGAEDAKAVGFDEETSCMAEFDGFEEFDTTTWERTFQWSSFGRIALSESTWQDSRTIRERCEEGWDFLHANSVDKSRDGDFFVSARFTNAIYKISKLDGSIIWRLGGVESDFEMGDLNFTGQHSVRYVSENETHTLITILDNAKIDDLPPTHQYSRGLLLALDTTTSPMTVSLVSEYSHPYGPGGYAKARGNLQALENGNVFIGWSEQATLSEHLSNGTLIMDAQLKPDWLGSYRNYKFPFIGQPKQEEIAVVSAAHFIDGEVTTEVFVSWNGATEVASWNLYDASEEEGKRQVLNLAARTSFETQILASGFAAYVVLEAFDVAGKSLGVSKVTYTTPPENQNANEKPTHTHQHKNDEGAPAAGTDDDLIKNVPPTPAAKILEDEILEHADPAAHSKLTFTTRYFAITALLAVALFVARIIVKRRRLIGRFGTMQNMRSSFFADDPEAEKAVPRRSRAASMLKHRHKPSR